MPPAGFEPTISAGERPQTYALDRAATGTGSFDLYLRLFIASVSKPTKMRLIGNVANMGELRKTYRILMGRAENKRTLERPR